MKRITVVLMAALVTLALPGCQNPASQERSDGSLENMAQVSAGDTHDTDSSTDKEEEAKMEPEQADAGSQAPDENGDGESTVYFTSDISPEGLMAVYEALGWEPEGNVAVKLSTGEPPASNG